MGNLRALIFGLDSPLVAPVLSKLHDEGVFSIARWIVNVSERNSEVFFHRNNIEVIEDKFNLNFKQESLDVVPAWIDEKIRPYLPTILQNFARETFYYRSPVYEYMNIIQLWTRYFYTRLIRDQINVVVFADIPHGGFMCVLYAVSKAMGLNTLILAPSGIFGTFGYCFSVEDYGAFTDVPRYRKLPEHFMKVEKTYKKKLFYMEGDHTPKYKRNLFEKLKFLYSPKEFFRERKQVFSRSLKKYNTISEFLLKKVIVNIFDRIEKKQYQENIIRYTEHNIDFDVDYVYFPLHLQPEMTTDTLGGIYSDQLLAIEKLRAMLPPDWMIYVKENPKQTKFMRQDYFFKRLKVLPNVKYVDRSIDTYLLLEKSRFVATITGTAGWEAITGGKNALIFGHIWYEAFPGVFKYYDGMQLDDILSYHIDHDELECAVNRYLEKTSESVFLNEIRNAMPAFDPEKNAEELEKFFRFIFSYIKEKRLPKTDSEKE